MDYKFISIPADANDSMTKYLSETLKKLNGPELHDWEPIAMTYLHSVVTVLLRKRG